MVNRELYYTPSIEEFHVGFEFEMKSTFGDGTVKTLKQYDEAVWSPVTYSLRSFPYVDRTMTGKNSKELPPAIRVKYLNQEDIESFGYKYNKEEEHCVRNKKIRGMSAGDDKTIYVRLDSSRYLNIWSVENRGFEEQLFWGAIRNKSEFKTLLKQMGL